jgi:hypothetical protein
VRSGRRDLLVGPAEGVPLARGIGHQAIFRAGIVVQPFVLRVILLVPVLAPAALLQNNDGKSGHGQLLGHDAAGSAGSDNNEINLG